MTTPAPAPLAATDLATETGWITAPAISPADAITLAALADWGIWPDDHAPSILEPLGEQFARQIGTGEAVEYAEAFELLRAVAHAAYAAGATDLTGGPLTCAECGDQDATGYVVTILNTADPKHTRTEVCTRCHE